MRRLLFFIGLAVLWLSATAQSGHEPLYIVNGVEYSNVSDIPEKNIESVETLPADETTVAKYGSRANNGVVIITLCYDKAAEFLGGKNFSEYIASQVKWGNNEPAARFVARYTVEADGTLTMGSQLQSTDKRFRKRILDAVSKAPKWQPATKAGKAVASEHLLTIQLPKGKRLPREPYIIML